MKEIEGYNGVYLISNDGIVYSKHSGKLVPLKMWLNHKGYFRISLSEKNKNKHHRVHRLVAIYFIDNPFNLPEVNHLDGNKSNNKVSNLEWCSGSSNYQHAAIMGKSPVGKGSDLEKYLEMKNRLFYQI